MVTEWCRRVLVALIGPFASKQLFCYTNPELSISYFWKLLFHFIGFLCITDYRYFLFVLSICLFYVIISDREHNMSNPANKAYYYSTINKTCFWANLIYLAIRVIYLILFLVSQLWIVAIIDGVTILIYGACFLLIKNKKYYPYALICGNEYFVFVSVMSSMIGFHTGFFFYLIGLCVVSFLVPCYRSKN